MLVHMNSRTQHQKPSARRIAAFAGLPIVAALALTGCASDDSDDDTGSAGSGSGSVGSSATDSSGSGSSSSGASGAASTGSNKALLAAVATARGEVGSGTVISVEQEQGASASAYEVLVVTKDGTEHEVHTNADGTSVAGTPQTEAADADDEAEHERFVAAADRSVKQAVDAFQDLHAGTVIELGLDDHVGTVVWEGDVLDSSGTKHSVRIDAGSGDVVTDRVDTDD
jgi:uncharacterized membrane protein YkoI